MPFFGTGYRATCHAECALGSIQPILQSFEIYLLRNCCCSEGYFRTLVFTYLWKRSKLRFIGAMQPDMRQPRCIWNKPRFCYSICLRLVSPLLGSPDSPASCTGFSHSSVMMHGGSPPLPNAMSILGSSNSLDSACSLLWKIDSSSRGTIKLLLSSKFQSCSSILDQSMSLLLRSLVATSTFCYRDGRITVLHVQLLVTQLIHRVLFA